MSDSITRLYPTDKLFALSHSNNSYSDLLDSSCYYVITDSHILSPKSELILFLYEGLFWQSIIHFYYSLLIPEHSDYIRSLMSVDSVLYMINKLKQPHHKLSAKGEAILLNALSSHFSLNAQPELTRSLLRTSNKKIVYHSGMDQLLSDGGDGLGSNLYGKMLTHIRSELRVLVMLEDSYGTGTSGLYPNLTEENLNEDFNTSIRHGEIYPANLIHINNENEKLCKLLPSSSEGFSYGGYIWPSVEHFYQSRKFRCLDRFLIMQTNVSDLRKFVYEDKLAKSLTRKNFKEEKISIMYAGLKMKFNNHPETKLTLLGTKNAFLMYSNQEEIFWGCGKAERGKNYLGKILMLLRKEFRFEERKSDTSNYPSLNFPFRNNVQFPKEYFDSLLLKSLHPNSKY
ncbi:Diaminohydroxyphosphoribosylaminopyrimidine deaminase [Oopsacas minuta]|uniref:Diaminohydroxyphosphoribosylaminopyrimidine deaminase n=1 Tax=Oopsacas minuta TaxID=111878 RepID=A0AAV7JD05_9METZ|nr:Diaminohydroxyphosphoribosylaminopyrimidine deaminase [Oopsacas minuta]